MVVPSGCQTAPKFLCSPCVRRRGAPPPVGISHRCDWYSSFSRSIVLTSYTARVPSGEGDTASRNWMSNNVSGVTGRFGMNGSYFCPDWKRRS